MTDTIEPTAASLRDQLLGQTDAGVEARLAFLLSCWSGWLPNAIRDGSAKQHFKLLAARIVQIEAAMIRRVGHENIVEVKLPPSPAALAAGWRLDHDVKMHLLIDDSAILDAAHARAHADALAVDLRGSIKARTIICNQRGFDCGPEVVIPKRPNRPRLVVRVVERRAIEAQRPLARALAKPLLRLAEAKERHDGR